MGCQRVNKLTALFREKVNYRFGVTSSLVVEAAGLDELPGPGCAFFMRWE